MNQLRLNWDFCDTQNLYYQLSPLNINTPRFRNLSGVYVIWHFEQNGIPFAIYTGQGKLKERLQCHQQQYTGIRLFVQWASVPTQDNRNRIERYLFDTLKPRDTKQAPCINPIVVNLPPPWSWGD